MFEEKVEQIKSSIRAVKTEEQAASNAFDAFFDGIKYSNSEETAITLKFPQTVRSNLFYKYDGRIYVCMIPRELGDTCIATEENFDDIMVSMEL